MDLLPGEEVIWRGHPTWRATIGWYLKSVPVALAPAIIAIVLDANGIGTGLPVYQWVLISILLLVGSLVVDTVKRAATHYTVTTRRLNIRRGILSRREQTTQLDRVQNINTSQSMLGRMLNVGDIDFDTAGTGEREADFRFAGVSDPHLIAERIAPYHGPDVKGAQRPGGL